MAEDYERRLLKKDVAKYTHQLRTNPLLEDLRQAVFGYARSVVLHGEEEPFTVRQGEVQKPLSSGDVAQGFVALPTFGLPASTIEGKQ